jgi:hypothetical protein
MERRNVKFTLKVATIVAAVLIIVGYSLFQAQNILKGPQINISEPEDGTMISQSLVSIVGTTKNVTSINLNNRPIFIDEQGRFKEDILLSYGYNVITVSAKDKFGRETEKRLHLVYK